MHKKGATDYRTRSTIETATEHVPNNNFTQICTQGSWLYISILGPVYAGFEPTVTSFYGFTPLQREGIISNVTYTSVRNVTTIRRRCY